MFILKFAKLVSDHIQIRGSGAFDYVSAIFFSKSDHSNYHRIMAKAVARYTVLYQPDFGTGIFLTITLFGFSEKCEFLD